MENTFIRQLLRMRRYCALPGERVRPLRYQFGN